jgi:hypothetical protein
MKIIKDIFPAHFSVAPAEFTEDIMSVDAQTNPPGVFYRDITRILILEDAKGQLIWVAQDTPTGVSLIFQERLEVYLPGKTNSDQFRGKTISGKVFAFRKDSNCGCGSRLKSWNPYRTVNSIKDTF